LLDLIREYDVIGAFWITIQLTLYAAVGSLLIGTIVAILRVSPVKIFSWAGATYVNIVRNTPLTLIVFFMFFCLYQLLSWHFSPLSARSSTHAFQWGVVGLSIYHASFVSEALRSGINTVPSVRNRWPALPIPGVDTGMNTVVMAAAAEPTLTIARVSPSPM